MTLKQLAYELKKFNIDNELITIGSFNCKRGLSAKECFFVVVKAPFFVNKNDNFLWDKIDAVQQSYNLSITILDTYPEDDGVTSILICDID